jgi:hypothetical protein
MVYFLLTPPGLYYLIGLIVILSLIVYWKRKPIWRELRRWRAIEFSIGPLTLGREPKKERKAKPAAGVSFGVIGQIV